MDFSDNSVGKESACNARDPNSIPRLVQSSYIYQGLFCGLVCDLYVSLIAQLVKNLPVMQETPVQFLGWEDPVEKG